ncbi:hypothetical protein BM536_037730 [Streptomyces phaeoluteigriseus]|uniref:Uncharacterized protein n=1 Tax=Streptomyces phaeoluteigriseus TaxID=114686 RepID=A0A1V6MHS0_9ACTN|nr:hypothetical protein BM536_037730 [Streptomyces phaeoluteigriseus]
MVHIPFVAIPVLPVIVIASPSPGMESLLVSAAAAATAAIGRLVWNFVSTRRCFSDHVRSQIMRAARVTVPR